MPINNGNHMRLNGFREQRQNSVHEYFQTQDTLLHAAAIHQEGMENLLQLYRNKVGRFSELNAQPTKSATDNKSLESMAKSILTLGTMLKSKNMLNAEEQQFLADLLASYGPVQVVRLARGVSMRRR